MGIITQLGIESLTLRLYYVTGSPRGFSKLFYFKLLPSASENTSGLNRNAAASENQKRLKSSGELKIILFDCVTMKS